MFNDVSCYLVSVLSATAVLQELSAYSKRVADIGIIFCFRHVLFVIMWNTFLME